MDVAGIVRQLDTRYRTTFLSVSNTLWSMAVHETATSAVMLQSMDTYSAYNMHTRMGVTGTSECALVLLRMDTYLVYSMHTNTAVD